MADLFWLTKAQTRRIKPYFPLSHGVPRVDDQRVVSGILHVIRNGLRWRDAPAGYGPQDIARPDAAPTVWCIAGHGRNRKQSRQKKGFQGNSFP